ncbi:hypothetical protein HacjB3_05300 [Halalkalicoccus jeotgali B3]|uniref:Right handed beta helix domain-containing protein n=1 Tax=Halalkalicoccus jeotgali (strain DSM 18796 / CECT 7217 / JCM 14584 / KCTC 4019 / B3) TaxID=795797 RepID=D8J9N9_HALJB|nr:hypothetical protein HacjB3_05300 [Halalkalicoccus jeotgali B3]
MRIDGPSWRPEMADGYRLLEQADVIDWPGYEPISRDGTTLSERDDMRSEVFSRGLNARVDGTVRNIEARGFTHAALSFGSRNHTPDVTVSRSMLHNCAVPGYGYGINLYNGTVTSELNYYDATRHAITGFGHPDCGYTCRGDLFGPNAMLTPIDMHNLDENGGEDGDLTAGKFLNTYECTFLARERFATPGWYSRSGCPAIGIRGHPAPGAPGYDTRDCQFVHFEEGDALDQRNVSFPTGWRRSGNEFGGLENWSEGKGAPVNWTGTSPAPSVDRTSGVEKRRASAQAGARCLGAVEAAMRAD